MIVRRKQLWKLIDCESVIVLVDVAVERTSSYDLQRDHRRTQCRVLSELDSMGNRG